MRDVVWQITSMASIVAFSALGLYLRKVVGRMDQRRDARRGR